jgi:hypothetical protein
MFFFSFFGINNFDTSEFLAGLEKVDSTYSQKVSIELFADTYCSDYKSVFMFVWDKYDKVLSAEGKQLFQNFDPEDGRQADVYTISTEEALHPEYLKFMLFISFLLVLSKKAISSFLYWLIFHKTRSPPTVASLVKLYEVLWGYEKVETTKALQKQRTKIERILEYIDIDNFDAESFQSCDSQSKEGWTRLLRLMITQLRTTFLGKRMWQSLSNVFKENSNDFKAALGKVTDPPKEGKTKYRFFDERRKSRREIRKFIRMFQSFMQMDGCEKDVFFSDGFAQSLTYLHNVTASIGNQMTACVQKNAVVPEELMGKFDALAAKSRLRMASGDDNDVEAKAQAAAGGWNVKKAELLEEKYKEDLTQPNEVLVERAHVAYEEAQRILASCNGFVRDDVDILAEIEEDDGANYGFDKPSDAPSRQTSTAEQGKDKQRNSQASRGSIVRSTASGQSDTDGRGTGAGDGAVDGADVEDGVDEDGDDSELVGDAVAQLERDQREEEVLGEEIDAGQYYDDDGYDNDNMNVPQEGAADEYDDDASPQDHPSAEYHDAEDAYTEIS